jgi:hypothetical protein
MAGTSGDDFPYVATRLFGFHGCGVGFGVELCERGEFGPFVSCIDSGAQPSTHAAEE